jgi:hypothetical protein
MSTFGSTSYATLTLVPRQSQVETAWLDRHRDASAANLFGKAQEPLRLLVKKDAKKLFFAGGVLQVSKEVIQASVNFIHLFSITVN